MQYIAVESSRLDASVEKCREMQEDEVQGRGQLISTVKGSSKITESQKNLLTCSKEEGTGVYLENSISFI